MAANSNNPAFQKSVSVLKNQTVSSNGSSGTQPRKRLLNYGPGGQHWLNSERLLFKIRCETPRVEGSYRVMHWLSLAVNVINGDEPNEKPDIFKSLQENIWDWFQRNKDKLKNDKAAKLQSTKTLEKDFEDFEFSLNLFLEKYKKNKVEFEASLIRRPSIPAQTQAQAPVQAQMQVYAQAQTPAQVPAQTRAPVSFSLAGTSKLNPEADEFVPGQQGSQQMQPLLMPRTAYQFNQAHQPQPQQPQPAPLLQYQQQVPPPQFRAPLMMPMPQIPGSVGATSCYPVNTQNGIQNGSLQNGVQNVYLSQFPAVNGVHSFPVLVPVSVQNPGFFPQFASYSVPVLSNPPLVSPQAGNAEAEYSYANAESPENVQTSQVAGEGVLLFGLQNPLARNYPVLNMSQAALNRLQSFSQSGGNEEVSSAVQFSGTPQAAPRTESKRRTQAATLRFESKRNTQGAAPKTEGKRNTQQKHGNKKNA